MNTTPKTESHGTLPRTRCAKTERRRVAPKIRAALLRDSHPPPMCLPESPW